MSLSSKVITAVLLGSSFLVAPTLPIRAWTPQQLFEFVFTGKKPEQNTPLRVLSIRTKHDLEKLTLIRDGETTSFDCERRLRAEQRLRELSELPKGVKIFEIIDEKDKLRHYQRVMGLRLGTRITLHLGGARGPSDFRYNQNFRHQNPVRSDLCRFNLGMDYDAGHLSLTSTHAFLLLSLRFLMKHQDINETDSKGTIYLINKSLLESLTDENRMRANTILRRIKTERATEGKNVYGKPVEILFEEDEEKGTFDINIDLVSILNNIQEFHQRRLTLTHMNVFDPMDEDTPLCSLASFNSDKIEQLLNKGQGSQTEPLKTIQINVGEKKNVQENSPPISSLPQQLVNVMRTVHGQCRDNPDNVGYEVRNRIPGDILQQSMPSVRPDIPGEYEEVLIDGEEELCAIRSVLAFFDPRWASHRDTTSAELLGYIASELTTFLGVKDEQEDGQLATRRATLYGAMAAHFWGSVAQRTTQGDRRLGALLRQIPDSVNTDFMRRIRTMLRNEVGDILSYARSQEEDLMTFLRTTPEGQGVLLAYMLGHLSGKNVGMESLETIGGILAALFNCYIITHAAGDPDAHLNEHNRFGDSTAQQVNVFHTTYTGNIERSGNTFVRNHFNLLLRRQALVEFLETAQRSNLVGLQSLLRPGESVASVLERTRNVLGLPAQSNTVFNKH